MKIKSQIRSGRREQGFVAVVTVVTVLGLMTVLVTVNSSNLSQLRQEIRLVEKQQLSRESVSASRPGSEAPVAGQISK